MSANTAAFDGGGITNASGTLTLLRSTVGPNNTSNSFGGGGIFNGSTLALTNSTVSGNTAIASGGGIYNASGGSAAVANSTITDNMAASGGGVFVDSIIMLPGTGVTFRNTIIAENEPNDCAAGLLGGSLSSAGFNLDSDNTCLLSAALNDIPGGEADLEALAGNGGPTQTHALGPDSEAIDAGNDGICDDTTPSDPPVGGIDQRGVTRSQDGDEDGSAQCDIGAFELEALAEPPDDDEDGVPPDGEQPDGETPGQVLIDITNNNLNLNDNDNLNNLLNNNLNENANDNANEQEQDSGQDQDNANDQVVNVSSSPDVNIGSD